MISGSDDFNVYVWEVPELPEAKAELTTVNRAFLVLAGHRSIVNQVRFNTDSHLIISAGVEKIVKVSRCALVLLCYAYTPLHGSTKLPAVRLQLNLLW